MAARAGERVADQAEGLRRLHLRQEPEPADLHAQDRTVELSGHVRSPQERPVPADRHDQVGSRRLVGIAGPDDLDAVVPQSGAERRRRVDGGARAPRAR